MSMIKQELAQLRVCAIAPLKFLMQFADQSSNSIELGFGNDPFRGKSVQQVARKPEGHYLLRSDIILK
jgi:hypothetical protein